MGDKKIFQLVFYTEDKTKVLLGVAKLDMTTGDLDTIVDPNIRGAWMEEVKGPMAVDLVECDMTEENGWRDHEVVATFRSLSSQVLNAFAGAHEAFVKGLQEGQRSIEGGS